MKKDVSEIYKTLSDIDHTLLRPASFLGSVVSEKSNQYILEEGKFVLKDVIYNPGFHKLFDEIISNSVDESKRPGTSLNTIKVEIDNNGRIINSIDRKLENAVYGGINLSEIKRDRDIECLEVGYDDKFIYTIENNESSITLEIDDDLNVYEVKDSAVDAELVMEENGDVYLEQIIMEI